jgi:hypothetical protein
MNSCLNCSKETLNPVFCSRSCSASYANKIKPKRKKEGKCAICNEIISASRAYCSDICRGKARSIARKNSKAKTGYENIKTHRQKVKLRAVQYKGDKCQICNYDKTPVNLSFHHLNPGKKDFNLSGNYHLTWETIQAELDKCILLCMNCHGEVHVGIIKIPD